MNSHRIRLPAPWQTSTEADGNANRVLFRRSFQRPSGLDEHSRLAIELELLEPRPVFVALNGQPCSLKHIRAESDAHLIWEAAVAPGQLQPINHIEVAIEITSEITDKIPSRTGPVGSADAPAPGPTSRAARSGGPSQHATDAPRIGHHYLKWVGLCIE